MYLKLPQVFFLAFRKLGPESFLSCGLWAGTEASAGTVVLSSGRNYAVYKNWEDSTQRQQGFGQQWEEGETMPKESRGAIENSLVHTVPIYRCREKYIFFAWAEVQAKKYLNCTLGRCQKNLYVCF